MGNRRHVSNVADLVAAGFSARTADSRPGPGPFTSRPDSSDRIPWLLHQHAQLQPGLQTGCSYENHGNQNHQQWPSSGCYPDGQ